jgi:hypothetical protein
MTLPGGSLPDEQFEKAVKAERASTNGIAALAGPASLRRSRTRKGDERCTRLGPERPDPRMVEAL